EPIMVVRGDDDRLRGFFNVCRHHAAAVLTAPEGKTSNLRCPYHGWSYSLAGELKDTPEFGGACDFDRSTSGLVPVETASWENWVFARINSDSQQGHSLNDYLGEDFLRQIHPLGLRDLHWMERRNYSFDCNWKV